MSSGTKTARRTRSSAPRSGASPHVAVRATSRAGDVSTGGVVAAGRVAAAAANLTLAQCARLITGLLWLGWVDWWNQRSWAAAPLLALVEAGGALTVMTLAVLVRSESGTRRLDAVLICGTLLIVGLVGVAGGTGEGYGTDELAYGQAAASAVLHGVNPYTADFTSSLRSFGVASGATMTLHGTVVGSIAYPSLSFLLYVPAVALMGDHSFAGILVDLSVWVGAGALLWRLMSPATRPWVPILLGVPVLLVSIVGGTNDPLYLPFELIAVWRWDRFGDPAERSAARWVGPVALGLACGIKQHPWLLVPFLVIGIALEAHHRGQDWKRLAARYSATVGAVFLIPNIPFIVWDPAGWISRILLPLTGHLVPMGIGPAGLLRAYSIGGGNLSMFGLASSAALAAVILLYLRHYPVLRRAIPVLPLVGLFLSTRSFSSYFAFGVPALAVNAASLRPGITASVAGRLARPMTAAVGFAAVAAIGFVGTGLLWAAPVRLTVASSHVGPSSLTASVVVTNVSGRTITPHFILAKGGQYEQGMEVTAGPAVLAPHSTTTLQLTTFISVMTPHAGDAFQVEVATTGPDTFAASPVTSAPTGG